MRTFKEFPEDSKCPICKTNENKECILIPIIETIDGNIAQAEIFHLDCINLLYNKDSRIIYHKFDK